MKMFAISICHQVDRATGTFPDVDKKSISIGLIASLAVDGSLRSDRDLDRPGIHLAASRHRY